jgi:hypothetical protein
MEHDRVESVLLCSGTIDRRSKARPFAACIRIGGIAQLVERLVRNEKVRGSNPLTSTKFASAKNFADDAAWTVLSICECPCRP